MDILRCIIRPPAAGFKKPRLHERAVVFAAEQRRVLRGGTGPLRLKACRNGQKTRLHRPDSNWNRGVSAGTGAKSIGIALIPIDFDTIPVGIGPVPIDFGLIPIDIDTIPIGIAPVPIGIAPIPIDFGLIPIDIDTIPIGIRAKQACSAASATRFLPAQAAEQRNRLPA